MEYKLPALFESLSEKESNLPLETADKIRRNELIVDMMNNGIIEFSQGAVDEIVREVDTRDKLEKIYQQVQNIKLKLPKKVLPKGAVLKVDKLPDGSVPIFKTEKPVSDCEFWKKEYQKDVEHLNNQIYKGLDIDKSVTKPEFFAGRPAIETLELPTDKIPVAPDGFTDPGMPTPSLGKELKDVVSFNKELQEMGIFSEFGAAHQLNEYMFWNEGNFDAVKSYIDIYRKCKNQEDKKIIADIIREIVKDINASRSRLLYKREKWDPQTLINKLASYSIFLSAREKEVFFKWNIKDLKNLEERIVSHSLIRFGFSAGHDYWDRSSEKLSETTSAMRIRDFILNTNHAIERIDRIMEHIENFRKGEEVVPAKTSLNKIPTSKMKFVKDLVQKLAAWNIIDNNPDACNKQYNKCMRWDWVAIDTLAKELDLISDLNQGLAERKERVRKLLAKLNIDELNLNSIYRSDTYQVHAKEYNKNERGSGQDFDENIRNLPEWQYNKIDNDFFNIRAERIKSNEGSGKLSTVEKEDSCFIQETKKAAVRIAATQLNKVTKEVLVTALPGDDSNTLKQFLASELGTSFISMINGMAVTYALKNNEAAQLIAKEFRVSSLTTAGNFVVEELLDVVTTVVTDSLLEKPQLKDPEIEVSYDDFVKEDNCLKVKRR